LRPIFGSSRRTGLTGASSPPVRAGCGGPAVAPRGIPDGADVDEPPLKVNAGGFFAG
jgi:hypothetical protein